MTLFENAPTKEENSGGVIEIPKKYLCECIDCVGEWTGIYKNKEDLERDILKYCRTGRATYTLIE